MFVSLRDVNKAVYLFFRHIFLIIHELLLTNDQFQSADIMEPPPDLKTIIDNTAKYVAKNGVVFEERIKTKQINNPKFKFLFSDDPLHSYYLAKVNDFRVSILGSLNEKQSDQVPANTSDIAPDQQSSHGIQSVESNDDDSKHGDHDNNRLEANHESTSFNHDQREFVQKQDHQEQTDDAGDNDLQSDRDNLASGVQPGTITRTGMLDEYIEEKTLKLEEPPDLIFLAKPAPTITLMEDDIIKLTARFIATYGRSFMLDLINREHENPIFDFIKPQHGQFTYMTNLIMQYALIINHPLGIVEELQKDMTSQKQLVDKFRMRTEWQKMLEKEKLEREESLEREKILYSQIDWHDFVIVETIDYQLDEKGEFPPTTADQVGTRLLMQQRLERTRVVPEEMDIDMDEDMDLESDPEPEHG